jgi:hypothetical protein
VLRLGPPWLFPAVGKKAAAGPALAAATASPLAERRAVREGLIELLPAQGPADLRDQLSLAPSEHRPGLQADAPAQALGRSRQPRRAPGIALREG